MKQESTGGCGGGYSIQRERKQSELAASEIAFVVDTLVRKTRWLITGSGAMSIARSDSVAALVRVAMAITVLVATGATVMASPILVSPMGSVFLSVSRPSIPCLASVVVIMIAVSVSVSVVLDSRTTVRAAGAMFMTDIYLSLVVGAVSGSISFRVALPISVSSARRVLLDPEWTTTIMDRR
jgi:hypothetical protein